MPSFIFEKTKKAETIILDTDIMYRHFLSELHPLNINPADVTEMIWQIVGRLEDVDDNVTSIKMSRMLDFETLMCKHVLENETKEKRLIKAVFEFGMSLHEHVKHLGLYEYSENTGCSFPYRIGRIVAGKIVLLELKS